MLKFGRCQDSYLRWSPCRQIDMLDTTWHLQICSAWTKTICFTTCLLYTMVTAVQQYEGQRDQVNTNQDPKKNIYGCLLYIINTATLIQVSMPPDFAKFWAHKDWTLLILHQPLQAQLWKSAGTNTEGVLKGVLFKAHSESTKQCYFSIILYRQRCSFPAIWKVGSAVEGDWSVETKKKEHSNRVDHMVRGKASRARCSGPV